MNQIILNHSMPLISGKNTGRPLRSGNFLCNILCNQAIPLIFLLAGLAVLSGCVSAARWLERAEQSWSFGLYSQSLDEALKSYEQAVYDDKDEMIMNSGKNFLMKKFPLFNEKLKRRAENLLKGSSNDKENAWKTYQTLVEVNNRFGDSIASSFLETVDYSVELQETKEIVIQIKYDKATDLIKQDQRRTYIQAVGLLKEINNLYSDYRDVNALLKVCYEKGTLIIAFSDRDTYFIYNLEKTHKTVGLSSSIQNRIRDYIKVHDNPDFLKFITTGSVQSATDAGAIIFFDYQGDIRIDSKIRDSYQHNGTIVWSRSYNGIPTLLVTRIVDIRSEVSSVPLNLSQSIMVDFYPVKYNTVSITADMYSDRFNNQPWMTSQLNRARKVMKEKDGSTAMVVWAEMLYGGSVNFLTTAHISGSGGEQELPIDSVVYHATSEFINTGLSEFLEFKDMDLEDQIVEELFNRFVAKVGIKNLLTNPGG